MLKMDLQFFADDIDNQDDNLEDDVTELEADLIAAIQKLNSENPNDEELEEESEEEEEEESEEEESEEEEDLEEEEEEETPPADTTKKKQSKEENAKFAKERREKEFQARLQAEIQKLKQEAPEFKLANELSTLTGKPVDQIMAEMREAALVKEATETKVPVEVLRKQREAEQKANDLERQINQLRFEQWNSKIKSDGEALQKQYTFLTQEDLDSAKSYILNVAKNVDMPLEDAVYAIHGKKIVENIAKGKVQDELANQSGRKKKVPLSPNNAPSKAKGTLTADEKEVAKAFGMTEEEYIKYKN